MGEETELQRGEVTLQDPTVKACRAKLRIKVSGGLVGSWRTYLPCLRRLLEKVQADLGVRGGV